MDDGTDRKIIEILYADSRTPNVEIARQVGLTEGAVRRRILNLVSSGVIQRFTIEVQTGVYFGLVMVKARHETKKMMAAIAALLLHQQAYEIAGEFDGCVILEGSSVEEIDSKIDRIRQLKEISDTKTYLSFKRW